MKLSAPPRHRVEQYRVDDADGVALWDLKAFAAECGHELEPIFPIFVVIVDGALSAFFYATPQVIIRPTVHPNLLSTRGFYDAATTVIARGKRVFVNPIWLINSKSKLASPELLAKVGLIEKSLRVFEVT